MTAFHRFDARGPVCGVAQGCNAADFDPPEVTCRRCCRIPPTPFQRQHYAYRDGRCFLVADFPPPGPVIPRYEGALA